MEVVVSRDELLWALEFLRRVVTRGQVEEEALVRLVERLEAAVGSVAA